MPNRTMHRGIALIATALMANAGSSRAAGPAATPTGASVDCVQIAQIRETRVRDDRTIDFIMNNHAVYRNTLPRDCPELGSEGAFSYETSISQLCSVDIVTVFRNSSPIRRGASCGLGRFQPIQLMPTTKAGRRR